MKLATRLLPLAPFVPMLALAQDLTYFNTFLNSFEALVETAIPIVFALAMLFFFWGVFVYFIYGAGDEEKRNTGKQFMIYSILGLVLLVAVWGIVNLLTNIIGIDSGSAGSIPETPS